MFTFKELISKINIDLTNKGNKKIQERFLKLLNKS